MTAAALAQYLLQSAPAATKSQRKLDSLCKDKKNAHSNIREWRRKKAFTMPEWTKSMADDEYLNTQAIMEMFGIKAQTQISQYMRNKVIPKPDKCTPRDDGKRNKHYWSIGLLRSHCIAHKQYVADKIKHYESEVRRLGKEIAGYERRKSAAPLFGVGLERLVMARFGDNNGKD